MESDGNDGGMGMPGGSAGTGADMLGAEESGINSTVFAMASL